MRLFGKEPALIIATVGALVNWLVTLELGWLDAGQAAAIVALLTAVLTAVTTRPIAPALFVGVLTAGAALFAEYGLHWSDASVTGLSSLLIAALALFGIRDQVTPKADPAPTAPASGPVR